MKTLPQTNGQLTKPLLRIVPPAAPPSKDVCQRCRGIGYLRVDVPFGHPQFGKPIECQCKEVERAAQRRKQLYELSQIGAMRNTRLETFNFHIPGTQIAFQAAHRFAHHPQGWLVLIGGDGCGKTHLAAAIANHCLDQNKVILFSTTADLLDHLRKTYTPTSPVAYDQRFTLMRNAELLVLDDLGVEQDTPWVREKLFQLLNSRYVEQLPTVITMNWSSLRTLEERIRSRLSDQSLVRSVKFDRVGDYRESHHVKTASSPQSPESS